MRTGVAVAIASVFFISGCSAATPGPDSTNLWAEEFALAEELATSDFEERVLGDGVVTREEYDEAHDLWLDCMQSYYPPDGPVRIGIRYVEELGTYETSVGSTGQSELSQAEQNTFDAMWDQCALGTIEIVGPPPGAVTAVKPHHSCAPSRLAASVLAWRPTVRGM